MRRARRMEAALERRADALLGSSFRLKQMPTDGLPRQRAAAGRPQGTPIDLSGGLAAALGALDARVCVVFIDGATPTLVSRIELARYFRSRYADALADQLEAAPAPGYTATCRLSPHWSAASAVVGALRVIGPRGTP